MAELNSGLLFAALLVPPATDVFPKKCRAISPPEPTVDISAELRRQTTGPHGGGGPVKGGPDLPHRPAFPEPQGVPFLASRNQALRGSAANASEIGRGPSWPSKGGTESFMANDET